MFAIGRRPATRQQVEADVRGIATSLDYPVIPLYEFLVRQAAAHPESTALLFYGQSTSYRSLFLQAKALAGALAKLGVRKGDRVAIVLPNCPQAVASYYGVLWAGAIVVMCNPLYTAKELQTQFRDSGARVVIGLDRFYSTIAAAARETEVEKIALTSIAEALPLTLRPFYYLKDGREVKKATWRDDSRVVMYRELLTSPPLENPVSVNPKEDLAALQYTGGTTGIPKGAMLSHYNLVANAVQIGARVPPLSQKPPTILGVLPFFHAYGMSVVMNYAVMTGARMVLLPRFQVQAVLRAIQRHRPQLFPGVPAIYVAINNYPKVHKYNLSSIECCVSGAAALPSSVQQAFERLTGGRLVEGYGLSEASPVTHINRFDAMQKPGSIGQPLANTECRIVHLETGEPLPPGEAGELLIRGPQVMKGYWNQPEETAAVLEDGWLFTGDVARMDADGFFYIVDRKKEMIIVSGHNVYPREVEEALYQHPAVKEAAAIGIPDALRGEVPKAFVVLKEDAPKPTDQDLIAWCLQTLAPYKAPKQVDFVAELPKSLIGKVLRRKLAEQERTPAG
ncbi:MAG: long-chain fatty acid--CoA ligase [Chloroflexi bacterium]|nr:long-chain fatty acid--CoA ligase [Chloroflexota bacterium]